jgi:DNA helicase-4
VGAVLCDRADGLLVTEGDKERLVAVSDMAQPACVAPGFFWSRLVISTAAETLSYGGFRKVALSRLAESLNSKLRQYAENQLEFACADLQSVAKEIQAFLSQQRYARDSRRTQLVNAALQAVVIQQHRFWDFFASTAQCQAAETASQFMQDSGRLVREANAAFVAREMTVFQQFFDTVEKKPLTSAQRRACIINEDNNLVLAGAGTGKTSTMIGRTGYLLASGQVQPDQVLMLAYARKAREEMQERQDQCLRPLLKAGTPTIKTFHALGLEIISKVEGKRPAISPFEEDDHAFARFIDEQLTEQLTSAVYKSKVVRYFTSYLYPYRNPFDFQSMQEYNDYVRQHELRTLNGEVVKSFEECAIANFLLQHGVRYTYEADYKISTVGPDFRQYKPDFFLPDFGIYIEHFALNKAGQPPPHFDPQRYLDGVRWKRALHHRHGTTLIETYSYLHRDGRLLSVLAEALQAAGVELSRRPDDDLLAALKKQGEVSKFAELLAKFLKLFKQCYRAWSELWDTAKRHRDAERLCFLLEIFQPLLERYQRHLAERKEIDFADMIGKAIEYVEMERFSSSYMHILVDEFQDISAARARLILALLRQRSESVLFAVGDDWQSIYRFTGSDVGLTKHFDKSFGATATTVLDTTFRFNNKIGDVASKFVQKNPEQVKKSIQSLSHVDEPAISLVRVLELERGLRLALEAISRHARPKPDEKTSVLVLARYNFLLDDCRTDMTVSTLDITFMTVHAAKGKEADYVVTLGLEKGKYGFPSEQETDAILEFLLPGNEAFPFAEERRLFYVALTRARHRVYLVYNPLIASNLIKELVNQEYPICSNEFDAAVVHGDVADVPCPHCKTGNLIPKTGKNGTFIGCNNFPYCQYTERPCPQCGDLMQREGRFKVCTNEVCEGIEPTCPDCGAAMVQRHGPYGVFWGCLNYRRDSDFICTHTENRIAFPTKAIKKRIIMRRCDEGSVSDHDV